MVSVIIIMDKNFTALKHAGFAQYLKMIKKI